MSVPDPALTDWVPLYPSGAQPIPAVENGKWLKGSGGAMVWSVIQPADIAGYPANVYKALRGDGTWKETPIIPAAAQYPNLQMQVGQHLSYWLDQSASIAITINLPVAWPSAHVGFWASAWPSASWTFFRVQSHGNPLNNSQGTCQWENNSVAQAVNVFWLSFGY